LAENKYPGIARACETCYDAAMKAFIGIEEAGRVLALVISGLVAAVAVSGRDSIKDYVPSCLWCPVNSY